jgi:hypothetical protein
MIPACLVTVSSDHPDNKLEKQHPTASTPIHDNHATADFATQPLVSPIQNHLTLPPVLP